MFVFHYRVGVIKSRWQGNNIVNGGQIELKHGFDRGFPQCHGLTYRFLYLCPTHTQTHPHTLPYPLPFGVEDEYSWRNQGERSPSGLLELICQVGDPPIPVFNYLVGSCLSSACAFSVSQAMASSSKCILQ